MNRLVWWFMFFLVLAFVTNLFEAIGGKVGGFIGLIAGIPAGYKVARAVTEPLIKEQEFRKREAETLAAHEREVAARVAAETAREAKETARAAEEAREANLYNFCDLAAAFDRSKATTRRVDQRYLRDVVAVALGGGNVGANEFERRDFEQVKESKVSEIRAEHLMFDVKVHSYIPDFDFQRKRFPVKLQIYGEDRLEIGVVARTANPKHKATQIEGFIPMETEQARRFRETNPSVETVAVIIRPVSGWRETGGSVHVRGELLGLHMLDANTGRPLVYPQT